MSDKLNIKGLSNVETNVLNHLIEELDAKTPRNLLRSSFYDGKRAVNQVGTVIPPQYAKLGLALGWTAKGVDGLARRCNLEKMVWLSGDLNSLGWQEFSDENLLLSEINQAETDSLLHGVSYLINTAGGEGEPKSLLHAKDALNAFGDYNVRTRKLDNLLSVTARNENKITGFVLYLNNLTISVQQDSSGWSVDKRPHSWGVPVEPMTFGPRTSRRMGRSRITRPAMGLQDAALRALIRLEAHMDIYTIPKMILLGADETIFKNPDGSQKAAWQVALGRAFGIPDNTDAEQDNQRADVKQFAAESPAPHLADLNTLAKLMARETDLGDADFALTDMANPTSGDSYLAGSQNLISTAESTTDAWSPPIRRSVVRGLAIQNGYSSVPDDWSGMQPKWRDARYISRSAAADAGAKQIGAVPWLADTAVGLELLGLDEQQIQRALADKRKAAGRAVLAALAPTAAPVKPPQADAVPA